MRNIVNQSGFHRGAFKLYGLTLILLVLIAVVLLLVDESTSAFIVAEGGVIETASAITHFICAIAVLYLGSNWAGKWHATVLFVMMGLRELDFHSSFTTMNISKIKFYLSTQVPIGEKLLGLMVVAVIVYAAYFLLRGSFRVWWNDLKIGNGCAYGVLLGLVFVALSKGLDGIARKLKALGINLDASNIASVKLFEETAELGISLFFGIAIWCYYRCARDRS